MSICIDDFVGYVPENIKQEVSQALVRFGAIAAMGQFDGSNLNLDQVMSFKKEQIEAYNKIYKAFETKLIGLGYSEMKGDRLVADVTSSGEVAVWITRISERLSAWGQGHS